MVWKTTRVTRPLSPPRTVEWSSLRTLKETSGALGSDSGGLLSADQSGDEVVERRSGADFIIGMRSGSSDFSIGKQLPREGLAQNEQFDGFAKRHFPIKQGDVLFSPGHIELRFNGFERNFLGKLLKAFFVELDAVVVVADQEFVQLFRRRALHGVQKLVNGKVTLLPGEHAFRQLGTA